MGDLLCVAVAVDTGGLLHNTTVTAISAGGDRTCAVADGRAYCWGLNNWGELGNNSTTESNVPVAVDTDGVLSDETVTAISAGQWHTAVLFDGPTGAPVTPPVTKKQTLAVKLPKRIKISGLTVITSKNARTNAGQLVRTRVSGGPTNPSAAGQVRYFNCAARPAGKTSIRTYGYPHLKLRVTLVPHTVTG